MKTIALHAVVWGEDNEFAGHVVLDDNGTPGVFVIPEDAHLFAAKQHNPTKVITFNVVLP